MATRLKRFIYREFVEPFIEASKYVRSIPKIPDRKKRSVYLGANTGNLYAGWTTTNYSQNQELRQDLNTLRARSRELARNNDYAKKYLRMIRTNVVGPRGIMLQARVADDKGKQDVKANDKIEYAWKTWGKKGICDRTGRYSFRDVQNLVMTSMARDGEVLIYKLYPRSNPFKFTLQVIEADHMDVNFNGRADNGNEIIMGVEVDDMDQAVAYHIHPKHPGDYFFSSVNRSADRIRIPADRMIHLYHPERVSGSRGVPWMHSAMARLNMIGGYEEAELTAARVSAAKMGFYMNPNGDPYQADDTESDTDNTPVNEVEPGIFETLPNGWDFKPFDPDHPTTAFKDFIKAVLRGAASGLNVSYNSLANDLEGVNYSSIRAGMLDERDAWQDLQSFLIEHFLEPVFMDWLRLALLSGAINLPIEKYDKFANIRWQPRGWKWVDPQKDILASKEAIKAGLTTASKVAAEQGEDIEDVYNQLAVENKMRKDKKVSTDIDLELTGGNKNEN